MNFTLNYSFHQSLYYAILKTSMRVIEPHQLKDVKKPKAKRKKRIVLVILALILLAALPQIYLFNNLASAPTTDEVKEPINNEQVTPQTEAPAPKPIKTFTGQEFKDLYTSIAYPNIESLVDPPEITGNVLADKRIRELADTRGYKLTAVPQGSIIKIDEPRLAGDDLLQPLAAQSWQALKEAARKDGIPLSLNAAYRSIDYQRDLFLQRLYANGTNALQIAQGAGDSAINNTLGLTAVPGYSRHHTGYTIDLWCEDGNYTFANSSCFTWISKDNYKVAKENGWIPSYPEGTDQQGPEPEPWEYVWVGTDSLREK